MTNSENSKDSEKELNKIKDVIGYMIIGNICLNMLVNMAIICF